MTENLRYIQLLRTRKCLATLLVSELIDVDKMLKKKTVKEERGFGLEAVNDSTTA